MPLATILKPARSSARYTAASWVTTSVQSRPDSTMAMTPASWPWARRRRLSTAAADSSSTLIAPPSGSHGIIPAGVLTEGPRPRGRLPALRADHGVDRGPLAVTGQDRAPGLLGPLDGQPGQRGHHVLHPVQDPRVLRATMAVRDVVDVMADDQQRPAGRKRGGRTLEQRAELIRRQVDVGEQDKVVAGRAGLVLPQVRLDPADAGQAAPGRQLGGLGQPGGREVDRGHLPAALGQPDGVPALTAAEVERPPGGQPGQLLDHETVGLRRPDQLRAGVQLVPLVLVHCLAPPLAAGRPGQALPACWAASCSAMLARTSSMSSSRALVMSSLSAAAGRAPGCAYSTTLSRMIISVGMELMPNEAASSCWASVSTLPNTASGYSSDACSKIGPNMRQGPHHAAQKSTSARSAPPITDSKFSAVSSTVAIGASSVPPGNLAQIPRGV